MTPSRDVAHKKLAASDDDDWDVPDDILIPLEDSPPAEQHRSARTGTASHAQSRQEQRPPCSEYLTKKETAERIRVHPKTVERAIIRGELPAYRGINNRPLVCRDELEEWLESRRYIPSIHDI